MLETQCRISWANNDYLEEDWIGTKSHALKRFLLFSACFRRQGPVGPIFLFHVGLQEARRCRLVGNT